MSEADERQAVVDAALAYVGTPYHHAGMVKGAGIDCATLLICAFRDSGVIVERRAQRYAEAARYMQTARENKPIPYYAQQWHLHQYSEKYLSILKHFFRQIAPPPQAGDVVLWKFGHVFSHAAIVVKWPVIVHARIGCAVQTENMTTATWLSIVGERGVDYNKPRPMLCLSYWGD